MSELWIAGAGPVRPDPGSFLREAERATNAWDLEAVLGVDPSRFEESRRRRYLAELRDRRGQLTELRRRARDGRLTLVYGAGDDQHNNAVVLADVLRRGLR